MFLCGCEGVVGCHVYLHPIFPDGALAEMAAVGAFLRFRRLDVAFVGWPRGERYINLINGNNRGNYCGGILANLVFLRYCKP